MSVTPRTTQDRVKLHYHTNSHNHVMLLHFVNGITPSLAAGRCTALANILKTYLTTLGGFDRVEMATAGSNVFNDIAFTPVAGTNTNAPEVNGRAQFLSFVGRTPQGKRVRLFFYTDLTIADASYRCTPAELSIVGSILTELRNNVNPIVAVDGGTPVWKDYANLGWSKYWTTRDRRA